MEEADPAEVVAPLRNDVPFNVDVRTALAVHRPPVDPHVRLNRIVSKWLSANGLEMTVDEVVPDKWEKLGNLVLLPVDWGGDGVAETLQAHRKQRDVWSAMAEALNAEALGVQAPIANDTFRSSQVRMLLGSPTSGLLTTESPSHLMPQRSCFHRGTSPNADASGRLT